MSLAEIILVIAAWAAVTVVLALTLNGIILHFYLRRPPRTQYPIDDYFSICDDPECPACHQLNYGPMNRWCDDPECEICNKDDE